MIEILTVKQTVIPFKSWYTLYYSIFKLRILVVALQYFGNVRTFCCRLRCVQVRRLENMIPGDTASTLSADEQIADLSSKVIYPLLHSSSNVWHLLCKLHWMNKYRVYGILYIYCQTKFGSNIGFIIWATHVCLAPVGHFLHKSWVKNICYTCTFWNLISELILFNSSRTTGPISSALSIKHWIILLSKNIQVFCFSDDRKFTTILV